MTPQEIKELQELFKADVATYHPDEFVIENFVRLNEDQAELITEAEMLVFDIKWNSVPSLVRIYDYYLDFIGIVVPPQTEGRTLELIQKARTICPTTLIEGRETGWIEAVDDEGWFLWFAKTFGGISNRLASAYYTKRCLNTSGLVTYPDE